jgi:hypothetical protein
MRIGLEPPLGRGDAHALQHLQRAPHCLGATDAIMPDDRFRDLLADRVDGIEREHRILEDHRGHAASVVGKRFAGEREHIRAADAHVACRRRTTFGINAQQSLQRDALARARFTQDAENFTRLKREAHTVDSVNAARAVERHIEVLDLDERVTGRAHAATAAAREWPEPGMTMRQAARCPAAPAT